MTTGARYPGEPVPRPTARVLLLDGADRALLFLMHSDDDQVFWCPPGGAIEAGETAEQAAARELTEETGWSEPVVGPLIGRRRHVVAWGGVTYDVHEDWYLARVPELDVDTSGFTDDERVDVSDHRWWGPADLAATAERLVPADLADIVERVLRHGPPAQPWTLGV